MDILRKELNGIYEAQCLSGERLDAAVVEECKATVAAMVGVHGACAVITDASCDRCYVFMGRLGELMGLPTGVEPQLSTGVEPQCQVVDSSDEDMIYNRLHPEDLVEKRMLEYEYFKYVDELSGEEKLRHKATCRIRILDKTGRYIVLDNSSQILRHSPSGKIWLILCCYDLSSDQSSVAGINPRIVNNHTGDIVELSLRERRGDILSGREKEILLLIKEGMASKQIADELGISVHTVNRHRQNIIEKLSVSNSIEAVSAATKMKLL